MFFTRSFNPSVHSIFSTISINEETSFLDLFSGSGSIGLEAISRGAKTVVFNDSNINAVKIINSNLDKLHEIREQFLQDAFNCVLNLREEFFNKFKTFICNRVYILVTINHLI